MPTGYLITLMFVASCTALALWPMSRPRLLGRLSFPLVTVVNELPQVAFLLLLASTLLAIGEDGLLDTPGGWVLAGVAGLTSIGLAVLLRRGLAARGVVATAMAEGLGARWHGALVEAPKSGLRPGAWLRVLLRAVPVPSPPGGADRKPFLW